MPDITMCADGKFKCALAAVCYRVQAKAHPKYQSYSDYHAYWDAMGDECNDFWPMTMKPKETASHSGPLHTDVSTEGDDRR